MRRPQATGLPHRRILLRISDSPHWQGAGKHCEAAYSRARVRIETAAVFRTLLERPRYFSLAFPVKRDILVSNYACEEAD